MKESNIFKKARETQSKYQEFITPFALREFIKRELGDVKNKIIFDPCLGSGQLLYDLECKKKIGCEIQEKACECARENGIDEVYNQDYIFFDDSQITYDVVITNYPFSLTPSEEQKKEIEEKENIKKFTGKLDRVFIKKSFLNAQKGYYLAFPGILYRREEKEFREWIIENNYLESVYFLEKTNFENTNITILLLILSKEKKDNKVKLKRYKEYEEKQSEETTEEELIKNNFTISLPEIKENEEIDINKVNTELYQKHLNNFFTFLKKELELKDLLGDVFCGIPKREEIIKDLQERIKEL